MRTKISELRQGRKLTQQQLAEAVGVTRQTIISMEQGKYNPSLLLAAAVTRALGLRFIEEVFIIDENNK